MRKPIEACRWALLLMLLAVAPACTAAVGAAAGAAAAIAYDERNASSQVAASVPEVVESTEAVFQEMGITTTHRGVAPDGAGAEIRGDHEGVAITVNIERESENTTEVVVTAREGELEYHPRHAGEILQRIIDRAS